MSSFNLHNKYVMEHSLQNIAVRCFKKSLLNSTLNQNTLAIELETSRQSVNAYLTGKSDFTLDKFEQFCDALGLTVGHVANEFEKQFLITDESVNTNLNLKVSGNENTTNQAGNSITTGKGQKHKAKIAQLENENLYLKKINETLENQVQDKYKQMDKQDIIITRLWANIDKLEKENEKLKQRN